MLVGQDQVSKTTNPYLRHLADNIKPSARNLGVVFDQNLNFDHHIMKLVQSCLLQPRNIAKISSVLPFISSRLDYCNSLFSCLNESAIARLQVVQNAAARLLTNTKRREHITPILAHLQWLPVRFRIHFKILLITFKALHGTGTLLYF